MAAGMPEPMADWQSQVYNCCTEFGCVMISNTRLRIMSKAEVLEKYRSLGRLPTAVSLELRRMHSQVRLPAGPCKRATACGAPA